MSSAPPTRNHQGWLETRSGPSFRSRDVGDGSRSPLIIEVSGQRKRPRAWRHWTLVVSAGAVSLEPLMGTLLPDNNFRQKNKWMENREAVIGGRRTELNWRESI